MFGHILQHKPFQECAVDEITFQGKTGNYLARAGAKPVTC